MIARLSPWLLAALLALIPGCCPGGKCIKDPPCRHCENPCCLSPIQKASLKQSTHALNSGPVVYLFENRPYVLFTEKGKEDFEKDPTGYKEKGALRLIKGGKSIFVDVNPGDDVDLPALAAQAVPYTAPSKAAK